MTLEKSTDQILSSVLPEKEGGYLAYDTPHAMKELAKLLGQLDDEFISILLASTLASEMHMLYPYRNDPFWWAEYTQDAPDREDAIKEEIERAIIAADRLSKMRDLFATYEERLRQPEDSIFILLDLSTAVMIADLPTADDTLVLEDFYVPNATYYKGIRQYRGFKGGTTGYSPLSLEANPQPRSGCLTRAFGNVLELTNPTPQLSGAQPMEKNGLRMFLVDEDQKYVVIAGTVNKQVQVVGQYDEDLVSPQEYILQVMYGCFANEPVVAISNMDETKLSAKDKSS